MAVRPVGSGQVVWGSRCGTAADPVPGLQARSGHLAVGPSGGTPDNCRVQERPQFIFGQAEETDAGDRRPRVSRATARVACRRRRRPVMPMRGCDPTPGPGTSASRGTTTAGHLLQPTRRNPLDALKRPTIGSVGRVIDGGVPIASLRKAVSSAEPNAAAMTAVCTAHNLALIGTPATLCTDRLHPGNRVISRPDCTDRRCARVR